MMADPAPAQDSIVGLAARIESWIALGQPGIVWTRYVSDLSRNEVLDKLSAGRDLPDWFSLLRRPKMRPFGWNTG